MQQLHERFLTPISPKPAHNESRIVTPCILEERKRNECRSDQFHMTHKLRAMRKRMFMLCFKFFLDYNFFFVII